MQRIADAVKTRTPQQCLHRWTKSLQPSIRRARWDESEDTALRAAVDVRLWVIALVTGGLTHGLQEVGTNWAAVRERVPGRTDMQVRGGGGGGGGRWALC
jgi:hypothetical protein